jgi:hypothetical protein
VRAGCEAPRWAVPAPRAQARRACFAACAGGADLSELYVTTREEGTGANASANAGGLFCVRVPGVRGLAPAYAFAG